MKSHKEIEIIDTAIFSFTSGFAPGEITSIVVLFFVVCLFVCFFFFSTKAQGGNNKGEMKTFSLLKLPNNFRLGGP